MLPDRCERFREVIEGARSFMLMSHLCPDGDSVGSEVALALHLARLGKKVEIWNESAVPSRYHFLTEELRLHSLDGEGRGFPPREPDVVICLDVNSWDYTGRLGDWVRSSGAKIVCVDHHHRSGPFGDLDLVVEGASSTGEVLYRFFRAVDAEITPRMARALYAALLFDTGGLRFGNAGNETVRIAGELLGYGVDHRELCHLLFERDTWPKIGLLRHALEQLRSERNGRLAWLALSDDLFRVAGARFADGDGILDDLLTLADLEIGVMFREVGRDAVKATFRSKPPHDVGLLAQTLGGGGRAGAAGVLLAGTLHDAIDLVLPRVHALLDERSGHLTSLPAPRPRARRAVYAEPRASAAQG